jgi:uncharacterized protein YjbI with pentapeptide repeats
MALTKKQVRQRWTDSSFQQEVMPLIAAIANGPAALAGVDLAGISVGQGPIQQLWSVNLYQAKLEDVDMSYADLACSMNETDMKRVRLAGAELDRCLIRKARLFNCDLEGAKLIVNLDDSVCEGCSFVRASFLGGKAGAEYGGRRVKFVGCDFTGAVFKGVEFRASQFVDCNFEGARFVQCDLRGDRAEGGILPRTSQFEKMDAPAWAIEARQ